MTTAAPTKITFTRLRNGSWGLRGPASRVAAGATVTVERRDGSSTTATVGHVLWSDHATALATIEGSRSRGSSRRSAGSGARCANCGRPGARSERADASGLVARVCGSCAREDRFSLSFA